MDETIDNVTVCVQVYEGDLKRSAEISIIFNIGTARCKYYTNLLINKCN